MRVTGGTGIRIYREHRAASDAALKSVGGEDAA